MTFTKPVLGPDRVPGVSLDEDTDFSVNLTDAERDRYRLLVEAAAARLGQHFKITTPTNPL